MPKYLFRKNGEQQRLFFELFSEMYKATPVISKCIKALASEEYFNVPVGTLNSLYWSKRDEYLTAKNTLLPEVIAEPVHHNVITNGGNNLLQKSIKESEEQEITNVEDTVNTNVTIENDISRDDLFKRITEDMETIHKFSNVLKKENTSLVDENETLRSVNASLLEESISIKQTSEETNKINSELEEEIKSLRDIKQKYDIMYETFSKLNQAMSSIGIEMAATKEPNSVVRLVNLGARPEIKLAIEPNGITNKI